MSIEDHSQLETPILLVLFNRPEVTQSTFDAVRRVKPMRLYVAADGPREGRPKEAVACSKVRKIVNQVDWPCEVFTKFSDVNLGCKMGEFTAMDWFFKNEEEGIVLEDDCCPDQSFFYYCQELLERFRNDTRVTMISGRNSLGDWKSDSQSYHFSKFGSVWGWAGWRRAWQYYDVDMKAWGDQSYKDAVRFFVGDENYSSRCVNYEGVYRGDIDTWDFQWSFAQSCQSGLTVVPAVNLISNIGFGDDATHTMDENDSMAKVESKTLNLPLSHLNIVVADSDFDKQLMALSRLSFVQRLIAYIKRRVL